jgi:hypothetical protein
MAATRGSGVRTVQVDKDFLCSGYSRRAGAPGPQDPQHVLKRLGVTDLRAPVMHPLWNGMQYGSELPHPLVSGLMTVSLYPPYL